MESTRNQRLTIFLNEGEREVLRAAAFVKDVSLPEYIRNCALQDAERLPKITFQKEPSCEHSRN